MQRFTRKNANKNRGTKKNSGIITIGLIYANWCGHCQSLKPEWKKMKHNVMKTPSYKKGMYKFMEIEESDKMKDAKINKMNNYIHGEKLAANGYPTVFKIKGGKLNYYEGDRNAHEMQKWYLEGAMNNNHKQSEDFERKPPSNIYSMFNRIMSGGKTRRKK
jgi:hypothetical protein